MFDIVVFLAVAWTLAFDIRRRRLTRRLGRSSLREYPLFASLSCARTLGVLVLLIGPTVGHAIAFARFLDDRGLRLFFDSFSPPHCWAFFDAGGYLYGIAAILGGFLAGNLLVVSPDRAPARDP